MLGRVVDVDSIYESEECVVCLDDEASRDKLSTVFLPCRHRCCCDACVAKIRDAKLGCPLCRQVIEDMRVYAFPDLDCVKPVPLELVAAFKQERRAAYRQQFLSVGGERMMNAGKATFTRIEDTLVVDYKVGRSKRHESVPYTELDSLLVDLKEQLAGQPLANVLELAIDYPEHFWLMRYHKAPIEETLREAGVLAKSRK